MDPITAIVMALAGGAGAGLGDVANRAIGDAYGALKAALVRRFPEARIEDLEGDPVDETRRATLETELRDAHADEDAELRRLAAVLADALESERERVEPVIGVSLKDVRGALVEFGDVHARRGVGVQVEGIDVERLRFGNVDAGEQRP